LRIARGFDDRPFRVADGDASPMCALDECAAPDGDERRVFGELGGRVLVLQVYPPVCFRIRRSNRSWATRSRAIAAGKSSPTW
jgi:hypothetical protein